MARKGRKDTSSVKLRDHNTCRQISREWAISHLQAYLYPHKEQATKGASAMKCNTIAEKTQKRIEEDQRHNAIPPRMSQ